MYDDKPGKKGKMRKQGKARGKKGKVAIRQKIPRIARIEFKKIWVNCYITNKFPFEFPCHAFVIRKKRIMIIQGILRKNVFEKSERKGAF